MSPFPVKDWKDGSGGGTKLNAVGLEDLEKRITDYIDEQLIATIAGVQPLDSDLTAIAGLSTTNIGRSLLAAANSAAIRTISEAASTTEAEAKVAKSLVDAKGDVLVGTADNTVARKAVGADGAVLLGDSAESDGLRWGTPKGVTIACRLCAISALPANTRTGGKLEANANGALGNIDGVAAVVGDVVLTPSESTGSNRAVYKITSLGSAGSKWVMERVPEFDASEETRPGMLLTVAEGTVCADSTWQLTTDGAITLGTTSLTFLPVRGPAIGCRVRRITSLTVPVSTATMMPWTDAGGTLGYNIGPCWVEANATRLVCPIPGLYLLTGSNQYDDENEPEGERSVFVTLNGGTKNTLLQIQHSFAGRNGRALNYSVLYRCTTAGDYLEIGFYQDSKGSRKIEPDQYGTGFEVSTATLERIR